jgi:hypothetical protein
MLRAKIFMILSCYVFGQPSLPIRRSNKEPNEHITKSTPTTKTANTAKTTLPKDFISSPFSC